MSSCVIGMLGLRKHRNGDFAHSAALKQKPCSLLTPLRCRCASVEKVSDSGYELCRRKWLGQHNAIRNALGAPVCGAGSAHIDNGKFWVDLSGLPGDFPA